MKCNRCLKEIEVSDIKSNKFFEYRTKALGNHYICQDCLVIYAIKCLQNLMVIDIKKFKDFMGL